MPKLIHVAIAAAGLVLTMTWAANAADLPADLRAMLDKSASLGQEYEGGAYSADTPERTEKGLRVGHWLAPGQEAVYRVDSEAIRKAEVTMR